MKNDDNLNTIDPISVIMWLVTLIIVFVLAIFILTDLKAKNYNLDIKLTENKILIDASKKMANTACFVAQKNKEYGISEDFYNPTKDAIATSVYMANKEYMEKISRKEEYRVAMANMAISDDKTAQNWCDFFNNIETLESPEGVVAKSDFPNGFSFLDN